MFLFVQKYWSHVRNILHNHFPFFFETTNLQNRVKLVCLSLDEIEQTDILLLQSAVITW